MCSFFVIPYPINTCLSNAKILCPLPKFQGILPASSFQLAQLNIYLFREDNSRFKTPLVLARDSPNKEPRVQIEGAEGPMLHTVSFYRYSVFYPYIRAFLRIYLLYFYLYISIHICLIFPSYPSLYFYLYISRSIYI